MHLTYHATAESDSSDRPALTRAEQLARVMAAELVRQDGGATDLAGDLTEFMVFVPIDLTALAAVILLRGTTSATFEVHDAPAP